MKRIPQLYQSGGEKRFAEHLKSQGKEFIYQPGTFCLGNTSYRPDFYVPSEQLYYEVVGSRQAIFQRRHKIEKLQELYPFIRIEIVNPDGSPYKLPVRRKKPSPIEPKPMLDKIYWQQWRLHHPHIKRESPVKFNGSRGGAFLPSHLKLLNNGFLTVRVVAEALKLSYETTLYRLKRGYVPGIHMQDGHYFVKRDVFEAWLKEQEVLCSA